MRKPIAGWRGNNARDSRSSRSRLRSSVRVLSVALDSEDPHRLGATFECEFADWLHRQGLARRSRDVFADENGPFVLLGGILQPRSDVYRVSDHGIGHAVSR